MVSSTQKQQQQQQQQKRKMHANLFLENLLK